MNKREFEKYQRHAKKSLYISVFNEKNVNH